MEVESTNRQIMRKAVRNLREQDRQKRFAVNRQDQRKVLKDHGMKEFQEIYGRIDEDNFSDHLEFFRKYVYDDRCNFMLLAYAPNLCEYLAQNCFDEDAFYILEALSHFEQIEITWMEEVMSSLMGNLKQKGRRALNIIDNLIDNGRYSQDVRESLLYFNFLEEAQELIAAYAQAQNEEELEFASFIYIDICFAMISRHPIPNIQQCTQILLALVPYLRENFKFRLYEFLNYVAHHSETNEQYALLLYSVFESCIEEDIPAFSEETVNFINYCARSGVKISHKMLKPLAACLCTPQNWQFSQIMNIFTHIACSTEQYDKNILYNEFQRQKTINYVLSIFKNVSNLKKIQILTFLEQIIIQLVKSLLQIYQAIICQSYYDENQEQLLTLLAQGLQSESDSLKQASLKLVLLIFATFKNNHITKQHCLVQLMQSRSIINMISEAVDHDPNDPQSLAVQISSIYDSL